MPGAAPASVRPGGCAASSRRRSARSAGRWPRSLTASCTTPTGGRDRSAAPTASDPQARVVRQTVRVLLTISADRSPALPTPSDLGFLLHKHPDRVQAFEVYGGTAHVLYPEVGDDRCTAAMVLEVDPVALVRGRSGSNDGFALGQYVNDRPYVASSLLSVAMGKIFRSALNGRCTGHEELVDAVL